MHGISRCRLLLNCTFLEERILTREKSHCMLHPSIFRLRWSMVLCDSFSLKMYLPTLKVILFLQEKTRNIVRYVINTLFLSLCLWTIFIANTYTGPLQASLGLKLKTNNAQASQAVGEQQPPFKQHQKNWNQFTVSFQEQHLTQPQSLSATRGCLFPGRDVLWLRGKARAEWKTYSLQPTAATVFSLKKANVWIINCKWLLGHRRRRRGWNLELLLLMYSIFISLLPMVWLLVISKDEWPARNELCLLIFQTGYTLSH